MKVRCVGRYGRDVPRNRRNPGRSDRTDFNVIVGNEYTVFGMDLIEGELSYLIDNHYNKPDWIPVELFIVVDDIIPEHWHFVAVSPRGEGLPVSEARWGYEELVRSDHHYIALEERDFEAMMVFDRERQRYESVSD